MNVESRTGIEIYLMNAGTSRRIINHAIQHLQASFYWQEHKQAWVHKFTSKHNYSSIMDEVIFSNLIPIFRARSASEAFSVAQGTSTHRFSVRSNK